MRMTSHARSLEGKFFCAKMATSEKFQLTSKSKPLKTQDLL